MCIYCETSNYRKIWQNHFGPIPKDDQGRSFEIHHIDGNRSNNNITNLICISIQEHYDIHYKQKDWGACVLIGRKMKKDPELIYELSCKAQRNRVKNKTHHLLGGNIQKKSNKQRILNGTHNWLSSNRSPITEEIKQKRKESALNRVENKTHNFLDGEKNRKTQIERIKSGTHNFVNQKHITCPLCGKSGRAGPLTRHMNSCLKKQ